METRYISLEDAIQAIEDIDENAGARGSGFTDPERIMRDSAFYALEAIQPADVVPTPRWISVKDRLPDEEEKYYLCFAKGGYQVICLWTDDIFGLCCVIGSFKNTSGEWGWSVHTKPRYDEITHWMPLPELPKEGGVENEGAN